MSVDYYHCESCNDSHYEEYVGSCNKCGNSLCTNCLVNNDVNSRYAYEYGYKFDSTNDELIKRLIDEGYHIKNEDGSFSYEDGDIVDDSSIQSKYCPFCSGNNIDRDVVLEYLIKEYGLDIKNVWEEIKNKNK
jgi:hypothetical protein